MIAATARCSIATARPARASSTFICIFSLVARSPGLQASGPRFSLEQTGQLEQATDYRDALNRFVLGGHGFRAPHEHATHPCAARTVDVLSEPSPTIRTPRFTPALSAAPKISDAAS